MTERARIEEAVRETVHDLLPGLDEDRVRGSAHLRDLGADSVDRVEIIVALLDRLGVREPLASFGDLPDLDALTDLLYDLLHERSGR
ncbi:phosphopantetheine-binding protein [Streptomyces tendae]|uniref:phosphopantetheine-binding protein n=1 Tax=Streptomyces tendae TaxID=1932 RepID=UPI0036B55276